MLWLRCAEQRFAVGVLAVSLSAAFLSDLPRCRRSRGEPTEIGRLSCTSARLKPQKSHVFYFTAVQLEQFAEPFKLLENMLLKRVKTSLQIRETALQLINTMFLTVKPPGKLFTLIKKLFTSIWKFRKSRVERAI